MASASAIMDGEARSNILMSGNIFVNVDQCVDGQHHHRRVERFGLFTNIQSKRESRQCRMCAHLGKGGQQFACKRYFRVLVCTPGPGLHQAPNSLNTRPWMWLQTLKLKRHQQN